VEVRRTATDTTVVLSDGLGHGIRARVPAILYANRLLTLMDRGLSMRAAFGSVVETIQQNRGKDQPWATLAVARVRQDGQWQLLAHESAPPVLIYSRHTAVLEGRPLKVGGATVVEVTGRLTNGGGLLLVSDGVTQAGLGQGLALGWTIEGVRRHVGACLSEGAGIADLPARVHARARELWAVSRGDDVTAVVLHTRPGRVVRILSGPPADRARDAEWIGGFLAGRGRQVVLGATTAQLVARHLRRRVRVEQDATSIVAPPRYFIEGIDLVCEGVVTLNQVYRILDEPAERWEPDSGVTQLARWLLESDRVDIRAGLARNLAADDIAFVQQGIHPRRVILELLCRALEARGKAVTCEWA
jgi:hypothetical protein